MPRETGKQRASGIPLDYFRHRNRLDRGKLLLAGAATLIAVVWITAGSLAGRHADAWYSPGRVTAAHAAFDTDCMQCHVSFTPIVSNSALAIEKTAIDAKCQACHKVGNKSSPSGHHASHDLAMLACSSCHHEHRGLAASLTLMADASCTTCHARIADHRAGPSLLTPPVAEVSRFDAEHHPEFRSIKTDPRKFKFTIASHHRHMTDGFGGDAGQTPVLTVGMLSNPQDKARYAPGQTDDKQPVHGLTCTACHQPNGPDSRADTVGDSRAAARGRSSGAYMAPVVYENQCRACHLLTIDPGAKATADGANHAFDVVAHRLQGPQLTAEVTRYWSDRYLHDNPQQLERPLPLPSRPTELEDKNAQQWIADKVTKSLDHLRKKCLECHELTAEGDSKASPVGDKLTEALSPRVLPVNIPQTWFEHAKFDHAAHRAVNCNMCHIGADPSALLAPNTVASSPMIPGRNTCIECHGPLQESADAPHGGARSDCVECHRFHNRDQKTNSP